LPRSAEAPGNVVQGHDVEISRTSTNSAAPPGLANLASCTNLADLASFALAASAGLRDATSMARTDDPIASLLADFEKGDEGARAKLFASQARPDPKTRRLSSPLTELFR
jgi:hypothetical protein